MTPAWHLAQINVARLLHPSGDARVGDFFAGLAAINAIADASDGFVWRLQEEDGGNATGIEAAPDPLLIVNLSVWRDVDALSAFAYRSEHTKYLARRREWFLPHDGAAMPLWWIPAGTLPTIDAGFARLWMLDRFGPSARAFTFRQRYLASAGAVLDRG